ncbi:MAG: hypothetical protein NZ534_07950 [Bacteroidia bacterium]|nr:hypothetical protein [Bacteroidia bacterium]
MKRFRLAYWGLALALTVTLGACSSSHGMFGKGNCNGMRTNNAR